MQITVRVEIEALGVRSESIVEEHATCTDDNARKVAETAAKAAHIAYVDALRGHSERT